MLIDSGHTFKSLTGFIVLEGVNGAGKSSLKAKLAEYLTQKGESVLLTHEPGGSPFGGTIRKLILDSQDFAPSPMSELFLFLADRSEHVNKVILPALRSRKLVISDRYYYSTLAFQGYGRQMDLDFLKRLNDKATTNARPDLVILLDLDPQIGLERNTNKLDADSLEKEDLQFHSRVRQGFLTLAQELPEPFAVIDAGMNQAAVISAATRYLDNWYEQFKQARSNRA